MPTTHPSPLLEPPPAGWKGCVFNRYINDATDANDGDIRDGPFSGGGKDWPAWAPVLPGDYVNPANPNVGAKWGGEPVAGYDLHGLPNGARWRPPARNARLARPSGSRRCNTTRR